jgi:pimeloyl-ACP methyl ester carboxylesterase
MNKSIKIKRRKKLSTTISIMSIIALSFILMTNVSPFPSANGQIENCHNLESKNAIPVLLIHGWNEGEGGSLPIHFDVWQQRLNQDKIPFCVISFKQSSDACGSSADHAKELAQIVQNIKSKTGQNQVNIVGYSKGGLDARVYLGNDLSNKDVANLIMVGTPNDGSPIASSAQLLPKSFRICWPAIDDLAEDSTATKVQINSNTNYYTIGGHWIPSQKFLFGVIFDFNCSSSLLLFNHLKLGNLIIIGEDDGVVPLDSAIDPEEDFENIGISRSCHLDLLGDEEYEMVKKEGILLQ